ncbi:PPE domain-containing protein [Saccharomonospora sp. NPDC046836]|uniref:PPE domain-containing protein n=1 Tax=Saccharomonospora sp. NPDC046836 TaxID=3156921 RepID=UPI0033DDEA24
MQLPINCLPYPWPPREPELETGDLGQSVNWLTYSHGELHSMVNSGLDLDSTTEIAAQWSRLGGELGDLGYELRQAFAAAEEGWQGVAAEKARASVGRLAGWTEETADGSAVVSGCVSEQAALASVAQRNMPDPPVVVYPQLPTPEIPRDCWRTGAEIVADPAPERDRNRELHQQAAEVMEQYQRDSHDLYSRVPAFTSPTPPTTFENPERPEPIPTDPTPPDDSTVASSAPGPSTGAPGAMGTGGVGSGGAATALPASPLSGTAGEQLGAGSRAGAATPVGGTSSAGAAAASPGSGAARTGMAPAAMPMGAAGARPAEEDAEHERPSYLQEEEDLWGMDVPVTPPVLGQEPPGRGGR